MVSSSCTRGALSAAEKRNSACGERCLLGAVSSPCESPARPSRKDWWWVLHRSLKPKSYISTILITPISLRFFLILSSPLYSGSPKWSLSFWLSHGNLYLFLISHMRVTYPDHLIIFHLSLASPYFPTEVQICSSPPYCSRAVWQNSWSNLLRFFRVFLSPFSHMRG
jgi:hypothetical protein